MHMLIVLLVNGVLVSLIMYKKKLSFTSLISSLNKRKITILISIVFTRKFILQSLYFDYTIWSLIHDMQIKLAVIILSAFQ